MLDRYQRSEKTCTDIVENKTNDFINQRFNDIDCSKTDDYIEISFKECQEEAERRNAYKYGVKYLLYSKA